MQLVRALRWKGMSVPAPRICVMLIHTDKYRNDLGTEVLKECVLHSSYGNGAKGYDVRIRDKRLQGV